MTTETWKGKKSTAITPSPFSQETVPPRKSSKRLVFREWLADQHVNVDQKGTGCTCKKTRCLKLYCQCFRASSTCGYSCQCSSCHNTPKHAPAVYQARSAILRRNSSAFKMGLRQKSTGCKCVRSACLKKYCECFQDAMACGSQCKCSNCKNTQDVWGQDGVPAPPKPIPAVVSSGTLSHPDGSTIMAAIAMTELFRAPKAETAKTEKPQDEPSNDSTKEISRDITTDNEESVLREPDRKRKAPSSPTSTTSATEETDAKKTKTSSRADAETRQVSTEDASPMDVQESRNPSPTSTTPMQFYAPSRPLPHHSFGPYHHPPPPHYLPYAHNVPVAYVYHHHYGAPRASPPYRGSPPPQQYRASPPPPPQPFRASPPRQEYRTSPPPCRSSPPLIAPYDNLIQTTGLPKGLSFRKICSKCGKTRREHGELGFGNKCIYQECGKCQAGLQAHKGQPMGILCQLTVAEGAKPGAAKAYERKIERLAARASLLSKRKWNREQSMMGN